MAALLKTFDVKLDGTANERQRFRSRITRSDTARQVGHVGTK